MGHILSWVMSYFGTYLIFGNDLYWIIIDFWAYLILKHIWFWNTYDFGNIWIWDILYCIDLYLLYCSNNVSIMWAKLTLYGVSMTQCQSLVKTQFQNQLCRIKIVTNISTKWWHMWSNTFNHIILRYKLGTMVVLNIFTSSLKGEIFFQNNISLFNSS